jgi:hypothetical protein
MKIDRDHVRDAFALTVIFDSGAGMVIGLAVMFAMSWGSCG